MTGGSNTSPRLPAAGAGPVRMSLRLAFLLLAAGIAFAAQAGQTLDGVKARGYLRCGVSEGIAGFSEKDATGRWTGFDADFCRAVAAAVAGRCRKGRVRAAQGLDPLPRAAGACHRPARAQHDLDPAARGAAPGALPGGPLPRRAGIHGAGRLAGIGTLADLAGAKICVEKGTTHEQNLRDWLDAGRPARRAGRRRFGRRRGRGPLRRQVRSPTPRTPRNWPRARLRAPGGPQAYVILPERISKEPLAPAVWAATTEWFLLVRWVLFALIAAEEHGMTQCQRRADGQADARPGPAPAHRRRGRLRQGLGVPRRLGRARHHGRRQLRRDVRAQPRARQPARDRARPEPPLDRGRADVRPAAALSREAHAMTDLQIYLTVGIFAGGHPGDRLRSHRHGGGGAARRLRPDRPRASWTPEDLAGRGPVGRRAAGAAVRRHGGGPRARDDRRLRARRRAASCAPPAGSGRRFLLLLVALVAPVCAFLPNATTVILLAPVIIRVARALEVDFVGADDPDRHRQQRRRHADPGRRPGDLPGRQRHRHDASGSTCSR